MWMLEGARGPHGKADLPVVNAEAADKVRYITFEQNARCEQFRTLLPSIGSEAEDGHHFRSHSPVGPNMINLIQTCSQPGA
jgi:hypothetical protein